MVFRSSLVSKIIVFLAFFAVSVVLPIFAFTPSSLGQDAAPQAVPQQTTIVSVDEVSLNLVVRDKRGKIVPDLKPEQISISDGGVPVKISSLRLVTGGDSDTGDRVVTFLFDRLDEAGEHNARDIAAKILKTVPQQGFVVSVMRAQGRLRLYQDFTSDRQRLSDAIILATDDESQSAPNTAESAETRVMAVAKVGMDGGVAASAPQRERAQVVLAALQESQRVMQELHTQPGLAGLLALSRTQRRLAGRKTVVYFSQGIRSDTSSGERLQDIVGAANRAGVSIYVVDTNALTGQVDQGLMAMMAMGNMRSASAQSGPAPVYNPSTLQPLPQGPPGLATMSSNQMDRFESGDSHGNRNPMAVLAESTGGAYVASGEDVKKPLRRMVEDMTTYYEASYASPVEEHDGQFRLVTVKPLRPDVKISSRSGYFALPPESGRTIRPFEAPLLKLLTQEQLPADVPFRARVLRLGESPYSGNQNTVVVEVPLSALETRSDPNTNLYSVRVSIVAQIRNKAGAVVEHFGEDIPRHGTLSSKESTPAITMQRHFATAPGQYVLEAVAFDQYGGKAGAQRLEFEIPEVTDGPSLSDVAIVQSIDPVPQESDPSEPMRYGKGKVVPAASEQVAKGTKELSLFFLVYPDATSAETPKLEMQVLKSGESIAKVPLAIGKTSGPVTIPYLTSLQSGRLPPGDYKVIERLTQGNKSVERELTFRITGPQAATELASAAKAEAANDDAEPVAGIQLPSGGGFGEHLVITALPKDAVATPTAEDLHGMVEGARARALAYSKNLPNFLCVEMTNRSVDESGSGRWKRRDSIAELLSYHDSKESRTTLEVNGKRSSISRADMNTDWPLSVGEFGAMLNLVFQPSSKTEFEWKEAATLGDGSGTVQVLSYRVARENATIVLNHGNDEAAVGFHGLVYLDPATSGVRRVTLEADGVPKSFAIRGAAMMVDYDFVAISGRDYLMPVRSTVTLVRPHRKLEMNEIAFRNYRRFASRTKIKMIH